jgi:sugar lactone lactonase YvrE
MHRPLFILLALLGLRFATAAEPTHRDFRRAAAAAYAKRDFAAARIATREALALRPDSPRYLHNLAATSALLGDYAAALDALTRLAALGVATPVERDPDFAALQGTPEFRAILQKLADNRAPQGAATGLAELPGRTGILEGIAWRERTGDLFLGDVHHRCIWRRDRDGRVVRFTAEGAEDILGVFGLAVDEPRGALWAALTALPEMEGYTPELVGAAGVGEFDLATGALRRVIPLPADGRDHGAGDILVAPEGTVYVSDSRAPIIWQLAPDAEEFVKLVDSAEFASLQGMVLVRRTLVFADYADGLFALDLDSRELRPLAPPAGATLLGLDGLAPAPGGLVATQNGTAPQRLLHIALSPDLSAITGVAVLAAALPHFTDLSLVTLVEGRPVCIAGAGWEGFDAAKTPHPAPHTVRLFQASFDR